MNEDLTCEQQNYWQLYLEINILIKLSNNGLKFAVILKR